MKTFDTIGDAQAAIYDLAATDIPEELRARFTELRASPSPVDKIVRMGELLYARRAEISETVLSLAGGLIAYATVNAWHGLDQDSRGNRIVQAVRRDLGEAHPTGGAWPAEADDPAPKPEFTAATPAAPPPPVVAA